MKRIFIYPKDVCILTGLSLRSAQRMLQKLRYLLGKEKHQRITVKEFALGQKMHHEDIHLI